jgi:diguanylate cyclase (GGDEF)-like protein/PAS domain S-box-containing protein
MALADRDHESLFCGELRYERATLVPMLCRMGAFWRARWFAWLTALVIVGAVAAGGAVWSASSRAKAETEQREQLLFVQLSAALGAERQVLGETAGGQVPASQLAAARRDHQVVSGLIERLRLLAAGGQPNDRIQRDVLPRLHKAVDESLAAVVRQGRGGLVPLPPSLVRATGLSLERMDKAVAAASSRQQMAVDVSRAASVRADVIGHGGAGLIALLIFGLLAYTQWMSARRDAGAALRAEQRRYQDIVETAHDGVWTINPEAVTTFVNPRMAEMLGREPEEMVGQRIFDFMDWSVAQDAQREFGRLGNGERFQLEFPFRARDGHEVWTLLSVSPMRGSVGEIAGALAMVADISERRRLEISLRDLADHDPLTAIYNRRFFIERLDRALLDADRGHFHGAVITLDLDHFKFANDTQGHATGDHMLVSVAGVLTTRARETDVVCRLGGDEFAVLLSNTDADGAMEFARDIRGLLCERPVGPPIGASIGVAVFDGDEEITADELLVCADIALYESKEHGGDQATLYTGQASGALTWVDRVRRALDEERFVLYGQPIIDLRTGRVDRQELLVRMLSEDGDVISPDSFIPTAERFGLIRELDRLIVRKGLQLACNGTRVSINLSGATMSDLAVVAAVEEAVAAGLRPGDVIFEVTETAAMSDMAAATSLAAQLRRLGCQLAIDDFGTGFGSYYSLKHLPARYLKIDAEFVREITSNPIDQEIIRLIVAVAHALDKLVIAEGVEDAQTLEILRELGADYAQGFHIKRPERLILPTAYEQSRQARRAGTTPQRAGVKLERV